MSGRSRSPSQHVRPAGHPIPVTLNALQHPRKPRPAQAQLLPQRLHHVADEPGLAPVERLQPSEVEPRGHFQPQIFLPACLLAELYGDEGSPGNVVVKVEGGVSNIAGMEEPLDGGLSR